MEGESEGGGCLTGGNRMWARRGRGGQPEREGRWGGGFGFREGGPGLRRREGTWNEKTCWQKKMEGPEPRVGVVVVVARVDGWEWRVDREDCSDPKGEREGRREKESTRTRTRSARESSLKEATPTIRPPNRVDSVEKTRINSRPRNFYEKIREAKVGIVVFGEWIG